MPEQATFERQSSKTTHTSKDDSEASRKPDRAKVPDKWHDPAKPPFPGMTWCPNHGRWGSHQPEQCNLGVRDDGMEPALFTTSARTEVVEGELLADSGSTVSYISQAEYERLIAIMAIPTRVSTHVMQTATHQETLAIFDITLTVGADRPVPEGTPASADESGAGDASDPKPDLNEMVSRARVGCELPQP
ncbi:hypothetical protein J8273_5580 [Carpediemonas membranifera]|uniref:Uncharacterized protein n=1 Tax=Carpediemonas membranifera TaxID=201153 RepID=A0A8J6AS29_9EUKA|nr:hypothetical protein J8273_5580 [Carpediemonas membranifera]|eukprot:KAG9392986.1 hypothetical protein J8273_5580 [Carpediemonas membranifera]